MELFYHNGRGVCVCVCLQKREGWEVWQWKAISDSLHDWDGLGASQGPQARKERAVHVDIDAVGEHTHGRGLCNSGCLSRACAVRWEIPWSQSRHSKGARLLPLITSNCQSGGALASPFLRVSVSLSLTDDKWGGNLNKCCCFKFTTFPSKAAPAPKTGQTRGCVCVRALSATNMIKNNNRLGCVFDPHMGPEAGSKQS